MYVCTMKTNDETNNSVKHNMVKNPKWQETDQLVGYGLVNMCDYSEGESKCKKKSQMARDRPAGWLWSCEHVRLF